MSLHRRALALLYVAVTACATSAAQQSSELATRPARATVSGTLTPVGPPWEGRIRVDAGESCVIDLTRSYELAGNLSGPADISFRILVAGPCGVPPGTYDEEWLARGTFEGTIRGARAAARFTYTARVFVGGRVDGRIVLGQGVDGELQVRGTFANGRLSYEDRAERAAGR